MTKPRSGNLSIIPAAIVDAGNRDLLVAADLRVSTLQICRLNTEHREGLLARKVELLS